MIDSNDALNEFDISQKINEFDHKIKT